VDEENVLNVSAAADVLEFGESVLDFSPAHRASNR
jgi:hypothetical protein